MYLSRKFYATFDETYRKEIKNPFRKQTWILHGFSMIFANF